MRHYELSRLAERDLDEIIDYTVAYHSFERMHDYTDALDHAAERLALGEGFYKKLPEIHPDLRVKRSGKHYIFGLMVGDKSMVVIAFFHESMDYIARLKDRLEG